MLLTCPGCGYKSIKQEYDICKVCEWEYDQIQNEDIHFSGGANQEDLYHHRLLVKRLLTATSKLGSDELAGFELDETFKFNESEE